MCAKLQTQIKDTIRVRNVLKRIDHSILLEDGTSVETFLIYLPCKDGVCDLAELLQLIKDVLFIQFSFSISEINNKLKLEIDGSQKEKLFRKAINNTSKHTAQGELGELLLFSLIEAYFDAPKILTKMSLKTDRKMAYHGADGVHAQFIDGELRLYLGESKLHKSFSGAKSDAIKSISESLDDNSYEFEFGKIETHIDFPDLDDTAKKIILNLTDPFSDDYMKENILHTPCFIGFMKKNIFSDDYDEYINKYLKLADRHVKRFYKSASDNKLSPHKTPLLLLPFSSVENFVKQFIDYMGIVE